MEPSREPSREPQRAVVESRSREPSAAVSGGAAEAPKPRRIEPLCADRYGVHFTADGEFCELFERVRGLAGHRLPNGDLMTLLKRGLEAYERELEKERFTVAASRDAARALRLRQSSPIPRRPVYPRPIPRQANAPARPVQSQS